MKLLSHCKLLPTYYNNWRMIPGKHLFNNAIRCLSTTPSYNVKHLKITQEKGATVVEAVIQDSSRKSKLLNLGGPDKDCPLCKLNVKLLHTDVLILSQFMDSDGHVLHPSITGLCRRQQRLVERLVDEAQRAGLLPGFHVEIIGKEDPTRKWKWEKLNTYFETPEEMILKERKIKERYYYEKPEKYKPTLKDIV